LKKNLTDEKRQEYIQALKEALNVGCNILEKGGRAVDAVEAAVRIMEGNMES